MKVCYIHFMGNLKNQWRTVLLGLVAGLFSSGLCLLAYEMDQPPSLITEFRAQGFVIERIGCYGEIRSPYWWVWVSGLHILLYVLATLVVYRLLSKRETSVFMLWQYIGLSVIAGWVLLLILEMIPRLMESWPFHLISPVSPSGLKVTAVAFAANVIYGTAIHVFARRWDA